MIFNLDESIPSLMPWRLLCALALLLLLAAVAIGSLSIQQKRYRLLWVAVPALCLSYFLGQGFVMASLGYVHSQTGFRIVSAFASWPGWLFWGLLLVLAAAEAILMRSLWLWEKNNITPMSVKEAVDSLPAGILCYDPGAKLLLVNHAIQELCRRALGTELIDGASFRDHLLEGELLPECSRLLVGGEPVIVLPEGRAWKLSESDIPYEKRSVRMLLALDISEAYRKTRELTQMRKNVERLGKQLQKVNREIMEVTAEREILNAKVKIHDELGSNLLAIKRYLVSGGTEKEKAELLEHTRRSVSFLKNDAPSAPLRDEYELLTSMAARLGLTLSVTGNLPQNEPHKSVIANAIHECFTNTLRHAQGDALFINISEDEAWLTAAFTNNGIAPQGGIIEKGGLKSLRQLTEQAGGSMTIQTRPAFVITIKLPKEDIYGL